MQLVLPPVDRLRQRAVLHPTAGGSGWPMRHRPRHPRRLKHPLRISNSALWYRAMGGNVPAAQAVVRIIEARARVLGLVQGGKPKRARCRQPQTVVLQDNDCRKRGCPDHA